jgi:hypothetical protein
MNRTVNVVGAASFAKLAGKLAGMLVGMFAAVALAAEVGGVRLDDKVSMGSQELSLAWREAGSGRSEEVASGDVVTNTEMPPQSQRRP